MLNVFSQDKLLDRDWEAEILLTSKHKGCPRGP